MRVLSKMLGIIWAATLFAVPGELPAQEERAEFSEAELEQLLAPIALYPDSLLSQVLMASTYPLEVIEAARWSRDHPGLEGEAAASAVADRDWDASIKALAAFPNILARMDQDLQWLERLGDAFAAQPAAVMDAAQALRQKASAAGSLDGLDHLDVSREQDDIALDSVSPEVVYVPYYDPAVAYGPWPWPAYPPYYWRPPSGYVGAGFVWIGGIRVRPGFSTLYWRRRVLVLVHPAPRPRTDFILRHRNRVDYASVWRIDPRHRRFPPHRGRMIAPPRPPSSRMPGYLEPPTVLRPPASGQPFVRPPPDPRSGKRGFILRHDRGR
jgi:hypothetical protein